MISKVIIAGETITSIRNNEFVIRIYHEREDEREAHLFLVSAGSSVPKAVNPGESIIVTGRIENSKIEAETIYYGSTLTMLKTISKVIIIGRLIDKSREEIKVRPQIGNEITVKTAGVVVSHLVLNEVVYVEGTLLQESSESLRPMIKAEKVFALFMD